MRASLVLAALGPGPGNAAIKRAVAQWKLELRPSWYVSLEPKRQRARRSGWRQTPRCTPRRKRHEPPRPSRRARE